MIDCSIKAGEYYSTLTLEETSRQLEEMKEKGLNVNDTIDLTEFKEAVREVYESEGLTEARDKLLSAIQ